MTIEFLDISAGLLFFVGTFLMVGSFEDHTHGDDKSSNRFMWMSTAAFVLGAILLGVDV